MNGEDELGQEFKKLGANNHKYEHSDSSIGRVVVRDVAIEDRKIGDQHDEEVPEFKGVFREEGKAIKANFEAVIDEKENQGQSRESDRQDLVSMKFEITGKRQAYILMEI